MNDYALVLNAGSSSLKFCVYARPPDGAWRLEARGQIEGIGTSPRLSAKDGAGERLADQPLDASVRDGRAALEALAAWLRSRYGGARVLGVGHRVVHGGAGYAGPTVVTPKVLDELRALIPLAPLHQPYNLAAIEAVSERLPGVPQVACFDTSFHRGAPAVAELVPLPREIRSKGVQRYGFHGLSYEYIASVLPERAPEIARGRVIVAHLGSGASVCALKNGKSVDHSLGLHRARRAVHGHAARRARSRRRAVPVPGPRARPRRTSRRCSTRSRACWASRASATTCATSPSARSPTPGWRSTISCTAPPGRSEASPPCWAGSTGSSSPPGSARTPPEIRARIGEACALARRRARPGGQRAQGPTHLQGGQQGPGVGHPDQRGADDRPTHRAVAGARPGSRLNPID